MKNNKNMGFFVTKKENMATFSHLFLHGSSPAEKSPAEKRNPVYILYKKQAQSDCKNLPQIPVLPWLSIICLKFFRVMKIFLQKPRRVTHQKSRAIQKKYREMRTLRHRPFLNPQQSERIIRHKCPGSIKIPNRSLTMSAPSPLAQRMSHLPRDKSREAERERNRSLMQG